MLTLQNFDQGVRDSWAEINSGPVEVRSREEAFPELATRFATRNPPILYAKIFKKSSFGNTRTVADLYGRSTDCGKRMANGSSS